MTSVTVYRKEILVLVKNHILKIMVSHIHLIGLISLFRRETKPKFNLSHIYIVSNFIKNTISSHLNFVFLPFLDLNLYFNF